MYTINYNVLPFSGIYSQVRLYFVQFHSAVSTAFPISVVDPDPDPFSQRYGFGSGVGSGSFPSLIYVGQTEIMLAK
jgi:hypothetical protein